MFFITCSMKIGICPGDSWDSRLVFEIGQLFGGVFISIRQKEVKQLHRSISSYRRMSKLKFTRSIFVV